MRTQHHEFILGFAEGMKCKTIDADAHWSAYIRQLTDAERNREEQRGRDRGRELGEECGRL